MTRRTLVTVGMRRVCPFETPVLVCRKYALLNDNHIRLFETDLGRIEAVKSNISLLHS